MAKATLPCGMSIFSSVNRFSGLPVAPYRLHVPSVPTQGAGASAWKGHRIAPMNSSRTELLEQEVRQLQLALQRRDVISICSFLDDYHGFATTD